jgi:hypothetical protein
VYNQGGIRGDYFVDRLGGWTEVVLALASFGIVSYRIVHSAIASDVVLLVLYGLEIVGAIAITRSKLALMRIALWLFSFRVIAGVAYMAVIHGDKLARSTLGFPLVVALYCWVRVRKLTLEP